MNEWVKSSKDWRMPLRPYGSNADHMDLLQILVKIMKAPGCVLETLVASLEAGWEKEATGVMAIH